LSRLSVLCVAALCAGAALVARLPAQEAIDFMREEWQRQNRTQPLSPPVAAPQTQPGLELTIRPPPEVAGTQAAGRAYCVRTCDGYYFPAPAGRASGEACRALCPGAATEIYRLSGGTESIERAVSAKGKRYSALPASLSYRTGLKAGCACGQPAASGLAALRQDGTLAPGDIVVTERGVHVFAGGAKPPYRARDFVPFRQVRGLSRETAAYLSGIDRPYHRTVRHSRQDSAESVRSAAAQISAAGESP
jgi:hypothetical protein